MVRNPCHSLKDILRNCSLPTIQPKYWKGRVFSSFMSNFTVIFIVFLRKSSAQYYQGFTPVKQISNKCCVSDYQYSFFYIEGKVHFTDCQ